MAHAFYEFEKFNVNLDTNIAPWNFSFHSLTLHHRTPVHDTSRPKRLKSYNTIEHSSRLCILPLGTRERRTYII